MKKEPGNEISGLNPMPFGNSPRRKARMAKGFPNDGIPLGFSFGFPERH
jgi:hypothetical protein